MPTPLTEQPRLFLAGGEPIRRLASTVDLARPLLGQRVRWSKDVLRVGIWNQPHWPEPWHVTLDTLRQIVFAFDQTNTDKDRTYVFLAAPGSDGQHDSRAENKIGEVETLRLGKDHRGRDCLYADCWTEHPTNPVVYHLDTLDHEVSVECRAWHSGGGLKYPNRLMHIAIVTHPVIPDQGPFVRQLSTLTETKGARRMATKDEIPADEGADDAAKTFSIDEVKEMLAKAGYVIPDIATTKESVMAVFAAMAGQPGTPEETPVDQAVAIAADPSKATPAQMASACKTLGKAYQLSTQKVVAHEAATKAQAKGNFAAALDQHVTRGAITKARRDELLTLHEVGGYQLATVADLSSIPDHAAVRMGQPLGRQLATAPGRVTTSGIPTDEECKAAAKAW